VSRRRPTIRQIYALAHALCAKTGEEFPESFADASALLARVRREIGHPRPDLDDHPRLRRPRRRRRIDAILHDEIVDELLR
jgi:hypothetical protein